MTKAEHIRLVTWRSKILQHAADGEPDGGADLPLLRHLAQDLLQVGAAPYGPTAMRGCAIAPERRSDHPRATPPEVVSKILYLRQQYHFGAGRIADYLRRFHQVSVARSTVHRLLGKHGLGRLPANQKHRPHRHALAAL